MTKESFDKLVDIVGKSTYEPKKLILSKEMINKFMQTQTCLRCGSQRCAQTEDWLEGCQKFKKFIEKETANMIQNYCECKNCFHENVCQYKGEQKEILTKMNGRLDNICCPDIFNFFFECKNFYNKDYIKDK